MGQPEVIGIFSDMAFHCVGPKESMCKLLGWLGGLNVTSVQVDSISLGILRCRLPTLVVVAGHVLLGFSKCGLCF